MKTAIENQFKLNISRVENLVKIYKRLLGGKGKGRRGHQETDILRAAIVLLHASVEDVLRSLASWKLPNAEHSELAKIPMIGTKDTKTNLGELAKHREKSVDEVIKESVNAKLERSNYNNSTDVCALLQSIALDTSTLAGYLQTLDESMQRRHQIVHRADANLTSGSGNHKVKSIKPLTIEKWIENTKQFVIAVLNQV